MLTVAQELSLKKKKPRKFNGFAFWDFESFVDEKTQCHVVNLAKLQRACVNCCDCESRCEKCKEMKTFYNIESFVDYMLSDECENFTFIAHNAKGISTLVN
jgi:hypothetical protein